MKLRDHLLLSFIVVLLFMTGCVAGVAKPVEKIALITKSEPIEEKTQYQYLEIKNCESTEELITNLENEFPVMIQVNITDEVISDTTKLASQIPEEIKSQLTSEIIETYQVEYNEAKKMSVETILQIAPDKIKYFSIIFHPLLYESILSFSMNNDSYSCAYSYQLTYPTISETILTNCTA